MPALILYFNNRWDHSSHQSSSHLVPVILQVIDLVKLTKNKLFLGRDTQSARQTTEQLTILCLI
uniref:Uncharacterized protein n=1 Tax=Arion vulgaris TaxID=1028688 RepID=A0A0B6ZCU6_9EUPU